MNPGLCSLALGAMLFLTLPAYAAEPVATQIGALRQRAIQAADVTQPYTLYLSGKAQVWLDFAFEEYIERDGAGLIEDALQRAQQLVSWLEQKQRESIADPIEIRGAIRIREDLWARLDSLKQEAKGFSCAAPYLGRAEVQLVWGGHEKEELGDRHARRYIAEAIQLLLDAEQKAQDCPQATQVQGSPQEVQVQDSPQEKIAQAAAIAEVVSRLTEASTMQAVARLPESVHFAYDKADLSPATDQVLRDLSDTLHAYPWLRLELVGHTDRIGGVAYNLKLSRLRAERVKQRLIELGLPEDRFSSRGLGKSRMLMQPDGLDARARDRRVQFVILNGPADAGTKIETQPQEADLQPGEKRHKR